MQYSQTFGGVDVILTKVRATLPNITGRYYDGLTQKPDGAYEGIEVKSNSACPTPHQLEFDDRVRAGEAATARLQGKQIRITSAYEIHITL